MSTTPYTNTTTETESVTPGTNDRQAKQPVVLPGRSSQLIVLMLVGLLWAAMFCQPLHAATADGPTEIQALLTALEQSGCRFQRNGSWYDAAEATAHLRRKEAYLQDRGLTDAETFIKQGASQSSISGQPYMVQCGDSAPVTSATWLQQKLSEIQAGK